MSVSGHGSRFARILLPNRRLPVAMLFAAVSLVTLFFGLKPRGYRFINQVHLLDSGGVAFTNIGMLYGKKTLGELGITDSMGIVMALRPFRTGRRLSRIIAIINDRGNDLVTLDQWKDGIEAALWDGKGNRIAISGFDGVLSPESIRTAALSISCHEIAVISGYTDRHEKRLKVLLPAGHLRTGRLILGLAADGRKPWRGEMAGFALFRHPVESLQINMCSETWRGKASAGPFTAKPAAFFRFDGQDGRTIVDHSGNGWNLALPVVPKLYRHDILQPITDRGVIDKSLVLDILVNFFGFLPFGASCFLLLRAGGLSPGRALGATVGAGAGLSFCIELWQVFIPTRSSQLIDVILNGVGAWLGAVVVRAVRESAEGSGGGCALGP